MSSPTPCPGNVETCATSVVRRTLSGAQASDTVYVAISGSRGYKVFEVQRVPFVRMLKRKFSELNKHFAEDNGPEFVTIALPNDSLPEVSVFLAVDDFLVPSLERAPTTGGRQAIQLIPRWEFGAKNVYSARCLDAEQMRAICSMGHPVSMASDDARPIKRLSTDWLSPSCVVL